MQGLSRRRFRQEVDRILDGICRYKRRKVVSSGSFARGDCQAASAGRVLDQALGLLPPQEEESA